MNKTIKIILVFYFLQGLIHNLGHPITPALVTNMGIPDYMFGVFFATMSLGLVFGGPIWGTLGDHGNKRRYIVLGLILYSFGQYMFGNVGNQYWMVFFRFVSGFSVVASSTLLLSILICESGKEKRTKHIAWSVAAFSLGSSAGYYVGGVLGSVPFFTSLLGDNIHGNIFLIQAILNLGYAWFVFVELKDLKEIKNGEKKPSLIQGFKDITKLNPILIVFLISLTFISIGMINVSKFIEVYMNELGYDSNAIGTFVGVTGIVSLLTSIFIVPLVVKLKKPMNIMTYTQFFSAVIIFIVFRNNDVIVVLYTVFMLYVVLKAIFSPLEQNYISSFAVEGKYGTMMGVRQSFFAIGLVVGPIIGGILYDIRPLLVFDFSVVMFLLGFTLLLLVKGKIKKELRREFK